MEQPRSKNAMRWEHFNMRKNYVADWTRLDTAIRKYEAKIGPLPGLATPDLRDTLIQQIIDSEQRVLYTERLRSRRLDPSATNPSSIGFDPLKAAILHNDSGDLDEAAWLVFLYVHFGKHKIAGWRYIRDTYSAFNSEPSRWWTWTRIAADPTSFRFWLEEHQQDYAQAPGPRGFGNHRKYVSLDALGDRGTGAAVESYVKWVLDAGGDHKERFESLQGHTPEETFQAVYASLRDVVQFGRIAKFDYTTMLGKLNLLDARPPHSYLVGATGPLTGARLLLRGDPRAGSAQELQSELAALARAIEVSPDVIEDSICNWQKTPTNYVRFSA
ncbi:alpha-glutamyl/putrescinyl thymine pyrophosphorylase clade 3 protein [Clavibacter lycopersici]|uniref:alpha-glutamyl/putrescinyl thymine pyrophosphorylase clade 3 protein n=2 Tax=Clavibacter lycopersici TaxID=2301718 RepID=UPI001313FB6E|nr:hypothetical protein [Clavibacter lycopersici]